MIVDTLVDRNGVGGAHMIEVRNLCKIYISGSHHVDAVKDVSFSMGPHERIGIAGGSGSGKSTLLRMLALLEKPTSGSLSVLGTDVASLQDPRQLYRKLQMMFQDPLSIMMGRMTIGDFLREPYGNFDILNGDQTADEDIEHWLNAVDVPLSVLSKYPNEVSGGQLQRIVLARIMSVRPELVLFDEPTSALDVVNQKLVLDLLLKLHDEVPFGYVFVSHDVGLLQAVTDRILVMNNGIVVEDIPSKDLLKAQHPYTQRLVEISR